MLLHSLWYLFGLLPVAVAGYWLFSLDNRASALSWLITVSLAFYLGSWLPEWQRVGWLVLILLSLLFTAGIARRLCAAPNAWLLWAGIAGNLAFPWVFKFGLHPYYYLLLVTWILSVVLLVRVTLRSLPLLKASLVTVLGAHLLLLFAIVVAGAILALLAGAPVARFDPLGLAAPLLAPGGVPLFILVVLAGTSFVGLLGYCWFPEGAVTTWSRVGLTLFAVLALALALVTPLAGIPGWRSAALPLLPFEASLDLGLPVSPLLMDVVLPLALAMFVLQQIAFLVDCHNGEVRPFQPLRYGFLMLFFPQLMLGPIVRHRDLAPQLAPDAPRMPWTFCVRLGAILIVIGLVKKVVIADGMAPFVDGYYGHVAAGGVLGLVEAWALAIAFLLRLFFDLSGYADMALGAAMMVGIRLPANFAAPLSAVGIAGFWRRWHMTFTRCFFEMVQRPLAALRPMRDWQGMTLILMMLVMGLWHGAEGQYLIWGLLNGLLLIGHFSLLRLQVAITGQARPVRAPLLRAPLVLLTFLLIAGAFVPLGAPDTRTAISVVHSLVGGGGASAPDWLPALWGRDTTSLFLDAFPDDGQLRLGAEAVFWGLLLLLLVWFGPSSSLVHDRFDAMRAERLLAHGHQNPGDAALAPQPRLGTRPVTQRKD